MTKTTAVSRRGRRTWLRRRISGLLALALGLIAMGAGYTLFAPQPQAAQAQENAAAQVRAGKQLFNNSCITCHGSNLQGVEGRGPSLVGVGEAAVFFQVSTGRMPAKRQGPQVPEKPVRFDPAQIEALGAYVQSVGGGPQVPEQPLTGGETAHGGELFRLNCSSCHNFTGEGGALALGTYAPVIDDNTPEQIYTAMISGPQNMPAFSDRQLTPEDKKDIIAYLETVRAGANSETNPGGYGLGNIGPSTEGVVAFAVGMTALVGAAVWIGARA